MSGGSVAVTLPADVVFGVASTDVINRLADLPIKSRIRAASSGSVKLQLMAELKCLRNQRGSCAVCPKPLSPPRSVYCSERCAYLWKVDVAQIKKATSDAEAGALNVACCESPEMQEDRPEKQTHQPITWIRAKSLWVRQQFYGQQVTVRVPIRAITDDLTSPGHHWLDNTHIDLCATRLLGDRIAQVVAWRLCRTGISTRSAHNRALLVVQRKLLYRATYDPELYRQVVEGLIETGRWERGPDCDPISGYVVVERVHG